MRFRLAVLAVLAPCVAAASPAPPSVGGWEFAHWGMSRGDVQAASRGAAHAPRDQPDSADDVVDGRHMLGRFKVLERLQYDEHGLSQISFEPVSGGCADLRAYLAATYGEPDDRGDAAAYRLTTWRDATGGNVLRLYVSDDDAICHLDLGPLPGAAD
jgi:hypothetical protein